MAIPKKIWIEPELVDDFDCKEEGFIEYTQTDVFIEKIYDYLKNYAFVDDDKKVYLPTLLHDFLKNSRTF